MDMPLYENLPRSFTLTPEYPDCGRVLEAITDFARQHG
jgi:hypothetical protein